MKYFLIAFAIFLLPAAGLAASLSLSPQQVTLTLGQTITFALVAHPASSTIASVKADIVYDPNVLEVTSFAFAPNWLPLTQLGYDVTDDARGVVIKTAGYPDGITAPTQFGMLTLRALRPGKATIVIAGDTQMLDSESGDQFWGSAGAAIVSVSGTDQNSNPAEMGPITVAPPGGATPLPLAAAAALSGVEVPLTDILIAVFFFVFGVLLTYILNRRAGKGG